MIHPTVVDPDPCPLARSVFWTVKTDTEQIRTTEVETLNNFWPFRFSKGVLILILFQIANLNRSYRNTCSHFHFFSKRKSGRPDFWKGVHIFVFDENQNVNTFPVQICTEKVFTFRFSSKTQMWTPFQKSGRPDLWFEEIENVNTFPKIWTARFAFWMKMKIRTPFENLNGQKLLRISTSGADSDRHLNYCWAPIK